MARTLSRQSSRIRSATGNDDLSLVPPERNSDEREQLISFLSLPQEIREMIYIHALVSPIVIEVFREKQRMKTTCYSRNPNKTNKKLIGATSRSLRYCAFNLSLACKTAYYEGMPIFYSRNTFSFEGEHDWNQEVCWLRSIGATNRSYLSSVIFAMRAPSVVYQHEDGSRDCGSDDEHDIYLLNGAHPRTPLLKCPEPGTLGGAGDVWEHGLVEDIDPAWEDVFRLLGERVSSNSARHITLRISNMHCGFPGVYEYADDQANNELWYTMDVPRVFEAWRVRHSSNGDNTEGNRKTIDVIWRGWPSIDYDDDDDEGLQIDDFFERLDEVGWEVLRYDPGGRTDLTLKPDQKLAQFEMRLRPLVGDIIADGPN